MNPKKLIISSWIMLVLGVLLSCLDNTKETEKSRPYITSAMMLMALAWASNKEE